MSVDVSQLNAAQREAVLHEEGPLLVLAGAGSGKTRVVTMRIARLLALGRPARSILAVTFTNKAAREMKERLIDQVGPSARGVWVSTFHSLCSRLLRKDAHRIGLSTAFTILDEGDQASQLSRVAKEQGLKLEEGVPRQVLQRISYAKNQGVRPGDPFPGTDDVSLLAARLMKPYAAHCRALSALDFDDLLLCARELLEQVPDVRKRYQALFRYVHVDEYQDTNPLQFDLVRLLVGPHNNLCVVGDDDQAIYGFRGACLDNILGFDALYAPCTVVKLEQNYRSTGRILACANAVIAKNEKRRAKTLYSALGDGPPVEVQATDDGEAEGDVVGSRIFDLVNGTHGEKVPPGEIAVLYRAGPQSRVFEEALRLRGVPYTVVGGQEFYARREVKDTLAWLTLIVRPDDEIAFRRVVNLPSRGLGDGAVGKILASAKQAGATILDHAAAGAPGALLKPKQEEALIAFATPLREARRLMEAVRADPEADLSEIAWRAVRDAGLDDALAAETDLKARDKMLEAGQEVLDAFASWCDRLHGASEAPDLEESWLVADATAAPLESFLDRIALDEEERQRAKDDAKKRDERKDKKKGDGRVQLMSLHASKGLEFPYVFLVGFEEGLLPHRRVLEEGGAEGVEEERRLAYVGITRARRQLVLTWAKFRRRRKAMHARRRSRFGDDLPPESITLITPQLLSVEEDPAAAFFAGMKERLAAPES